MSYQNDYFWQSATDASIIVGAYHCMMISYCPKSPQVYRAIALLLLHGSQKKIAHPCTCLFITPLIPLFHLYSDVLSSSSPLRAKTSSIVPVSAQFLSPIFTLRDTNFCDDSLNSLLMSNGVNPKKWGAPVELLV